MKISFVIPSYNCVTYLPHAVTSCVQQTHRDIEIIVVNDGSTDRTGEYLDWLAKNEPRVTIIHPGKNIGRSAARNLGNDAAKGDVICVLDADDISTPNRAEIIARRFRAGNVDYVYGASTTIDCIGRPLGIVNPDAAPTRDLLDEKKNPSLQNRIVHSSVAYTKEFAKRYPYRGGDIARLGIDDYCQQSEALADGAKFDFVPQRLCCYRILSSQITKTRNEAEVLEAKRTFLASLAQPV